VNELRIVLGKYEILEEIGVGGMSRVYKARDTKMGKLWAIKEIDKANANNVKNLDVIVGNFVAEAKIITQFDHPAIPRVVDIHDDENTMLIVMDYVEGVTLQDVGRVSPADAARYVLTIAEAVDYLHNLGIIYRDIKPHNIMLNKRDHVKLIDFGTAIENVPEVIASAPKMGTKGYAAPEQSTAEYGPQVDVYALGVTLWQLLTGKKPDGRFEVENSHRLNKIVRRATQKDPAKRYPDMKAMIRDLREYKPQRNTKKYWYLLGGVAILALAAIAVFQFDSTETYNEYWKAADRANDVSAANVQLYKAIEVRPGSVAPFTQIIKNDEADGIYSDFEREKLESAFEAHLPKLEKSDKFAKLAFRMGTLNWFFTKREEENTLRGEAESRYYFKLVSEYSEENAPVNALAKIYLKVAEYDLSKMRDATLKVAKKPDFKADYGLVLKLDIAKEMKAPLLNLLKEKINEVELGEKNER
jgi:serine/threonine-protein kinase